MRYRGGSEKVASHCVRVTPNFQAHRRAKGKRSAAFGTSVWSVMLEVSHFSALIFDFAQLGVTLLNQTLVFVRVFCLILKVVAYEW